jgi:hypothetical protein
MTAEPRSGERAAHNGCEPLEGGALQRRQPLQTGDERQRAVASFVS